MDITRISTAERPFRLTLKWPGLGIFKPFVADWDWPDRSEVVEAGCFFRRRAAPLKTPTEQIPRQQKLESKKENFATVSTKV